MTGIIIFIGGLLIGVLIKSVEKRKVKELVLKPIRTKYEIVYYPLTNEYRATVDGRFVFKTAEGTFRLHSTPSKFYAYNTRKEAEEFLALYLEWTGKDTIITPANI